MAWVRFVAWMLAFLFASPSLAQEIRTTFTLTMDSSLGFTLAVQNASTAPRSLKSYKLTLAPTTMVFDDAGTSTPPIACVPNVGTNNDNISANAITCTLGSLLLPGQTLTLVNGDIDGPLALPSGLAIDATYDDGTVISGMFVPGTTWTATLIKSSIPMYSLNLSWQPPTTNTDNSPYTNPGGYKLYWGSMSGGPYANSVTINNPTTLNYAVPLPAGSYYFVATAFNTLGSESVFSAVANGIASPKPAPLPPLAAGSHVVGPEGTAYVIFQTRDNGALVPTGTVPLGTACNGSIGFRDVQHGDMYVVPKAAVVFAGDSEAELVFAKCVAN